MNAKQRRKLKRTKTNFPTFMFIDSGQNNITGVLDKWKKFAMSPKIENNLPIYSESSNH